MSDYFDIGSIFDQIIIFDFILIFISKDIFTSVKLTERKASNCHFHGVLQLKKINFFDLQWCLTPLYITKC